MTCALKSHIPALTLQVVVTDMKHPKWKYYFPCGQWLAKDEGDGLICRDLLGSRDPLAVRKRKPHMYSYIASFAWRAFYMYIAILYMVVLIKNVVSKL